MMRALFSSHGIWELVENGYPEPADAAALTALTVVERNFLRYNRKKDSKALLYLFQSVHESIFPRIAGTTMSKTTYQGMEKVKTAKLEMWRRVFETLCMKLSETID